MNTDIESCIGRPELGAGRVRSGRDARSHSPALLALVAAAFSAVMVGEGRAAIIAGDSYVVGNPGYATGNLVSTTTAQPLGTTDPPNSTGFYTPGTAVGVDPGQGHYYGGGTGTGIINIASSGLTTAATGYGGATGGAVTMTPSANTAAGGRAGNRGLAPYTGANTYYMSVLLSTSGGTALSSGEAGYVEFSNRIPTSISGAFLGSSASDRGFLLGINGNGSADNLVIQTASGANNALVSHTVTSGIAHGATHLVIVRVDLNNVSGSLDTFTTYVDPANVTTEPGVATSTFTADALTNNTDISRIGFQVNYIDLTSSDGKSLGADELRFGTTFADVVSPVPEPGSLCVLGIAGLGLLGRRRIRRRIGG